MPGSIGEQLRGTAANTRDLVTGVSLGNLLPPSILSTLAFIRDAVPRSVGFADTAARQATGVVVVAITMVVASLTVLTWLAVAFAVLFGPLALLRLIPAVDDRWPLSASTWPLWEVRE